MTSTSASEQIHTTLNGQSQDIVTPHRKRASLLLEEHESCVRLGCGSQGSCGSCLVVVKGKPRMSCTLRAKNLDRKIVQTLQGIPLSRRKEILHAFLAIGAGQCGYCMPGIITQVHTLLSKIEHPTVEQINKALSLHSCRCLSPDLLTRAVNSLIEKVQTEHTPLPSPFYNEMLGLTHTLKEFTLPEMYVAHPLFTWDTNHAIFELESHALQDVHIVSRTEIPKEIRDAHPTLLGFLLSTDKGTAQQTLETYALGREPTSPSPYETESNSRILLPYDDAPLESEVCVVAEGVIRLNGVESVGLSKRFKNYRIEQWKVGGSFGSRSFSDHVDWAVWLHERFNAPISMQLSMAQMLRLRSKHPFVEFAYTNSFRIFIQVEPTTDTTLIAWTKQLQQHVQQITEQLVEAVHPSSPSGVTVSVSHRQNPTSNIQERASEVRMAQVSALLLESLCEREPDPIVARLSFLDQVRTKYNVSNSWLETVQEHAQLCQQNSELGWGLSIVPHHTHTLTQPMTGTLTIFEDTISDKASSRSATVALGLPITNDVLVTTIQALVHRLTNIPTDQITYTCTGDHPSPMDDPSTLRAHCIHAVTELCKQYRQSHDSQTYKYAHQSLEMPTSACSVLLTIDEKGNPLNTWISIPLDDYTPLVQTQAELSGRWMRSLGREQLWHSGATPSGLFKNLHTLKSKDAISVHWTAIENSPSPTGWTTVNGATMAAITNARRKVGLPHTVVPFAKGR